MLLLEKERTVLFEEMPPSIADQMRWLGSNLERATELESEEEWLRGIEQAWRQIDRIADELNTLEAEIPPADELDKKLTWTVRCIREAVGHYRRALDFLGDWLEEDENAWQGYVRAVDAGTASLAAGIPDGTCLASCVV